MPTPDQPTDDPLVFLDDANHANHADSPGLIQAPKGDTVKIMIVDDEADIHRVTRYALHDYSFNDKRLEFIDAYSGEEARRLLARHSDIAVVLLDVVMETDDAGLVLAQYIRESMGNTMVRIILRTGQPGRAPESEVLKKYQINDYRNKTELTEDKLSSSVTANLRSWDDLMKVELYRQELERIVDERTHELKRKNRELLALNQEKNEFLSVAAHDLKNPLSIIKGFADMIGNDFRELSECDVVEYATTISGSADRMFKLIKRMLDADAIESGELQISLASINVADVVRKVIADFESVAERKQIALRHILPDGNAFALADEGALYQILDNLVSNGIKYSEPGTEVLIRMTSTSDAVHVEVADQGPGFTAVDQKRMFSKFARLSARPTGGENSHGLGLYVVKRLVEQIDGVITCTTNPGSGTSFRLRFQTCEQAR